MKPAKQHAIIRPHTSPLEIELPKRLADSAAFVAKGKRRDGMVHPYIIIGKSGEIFICAYFSAGKILVVTEFENIDNLRKKTYGTATKYNCAGKKTKETQALDYRELEGLNYVSKKSVANAKEFFMKCRAEHHTRLRRQTSPQDARTGAHVARAATRRAAPAKSGQISR